MTSMADVPFYAIIYVTFLLSLPPLSPSQTKPSAPVKKVASPAMSSIPSASSRLPQRSGIGQPSGTGTAVSHLTVLYVCDGFILT